MIAPALKTVLTRFGEADKYKWKNVVSKLKDLQVAKHIIIIHGNRDTTVPLQDSQELKGFLPEIELVVMD